MPDHNFPRSIWLIAGEESGDYLGAKLIGALKNRFGAENIMFSGVGGSFMEEEGFHSLFPMSDLSVMGITAVLGSLPRLIKRIKETAKAVIDAKPDLLIIIDSPDFTHRVAKAVRAELKDLPIIDYISPSVWAWREGRSAGMKPYVDHILAILPFEPAVHELLGGPKCTYVGHPLIERLDEFRPKEGERSDYKEGDLQLVVLPGSRRTEVDYLMDVFGQAVHQFIGMFRRETGRNVQVTLPAVSHMGTKIRELVQSWDDKPNIVTGEEAKLAAFRSAHVALAASGTVTLELALSHIPMVVAYKVSKIEEAIGSLLIKAQSIVLPNLILEENVVPEYIQKQCNPPTLALALSRISQETASRNKQLKAFDRLDSLMSVAPETPSQRAVQVIERVFREHNNS